MLMRRASLRAFHTCLTAWPAPSWDRTSSSTARNATRLRLPRASFGLTRAPGRLTLLLAISYPSLPDHWPPLKFISVHQASLIFIGIHYASLAFIRIHSSSFIFTSLHLPPFQFIRSHRFHPLSIRLLRTRTCAVFRQRRRS